MLYPPSNSLFTPASTPSPAPPKKSASSPSFRVPPPRPRMPDSDDDRDDDSAIYTAWHDTPPTLRTRASTVPAPSRARDKPPKCISTTPGQYGAGETETEVDEPPRQLPTARIIPASRPLIPPHSLQQRLTPLLFESSRLLSVVPAVFGTLYNLYHVCCAPVPAPNHASPAPIDYLVSALWAILTGYQCLRLTTGLLARWRLYYPPLPTLIRLLALQAICWPATHLTLTILGHERRPVIVWAVVGSTTCMSRSVQIWVTSNLWWETGTAEGPGPGRRYLRWGGAWGGRRWDWTEVGIKCALPAGILYFVMAWAEALRREWAGC